MNPLVSVYTHARGFAAPLRLPARADAGGCALFAAPSDNVVTLVDVILRDKDPAEQEVPTLLFRAKDAEA